MKEDFGVKTVDIIPPIVLFLDDGVHVFASAKEAEQHLEAIDVRAHPEWHGFDSKACGLRLEIIGYKRKVFGIFTLQDERIELQMDQSRSLDEVSDTLRDQMRDYLFGINYEKLGGKLIQLSAKDMFDQILKR